MNDSTTSNDDRGGLLSIILPAYNEVEVLPQTLARLTQMAPAFARYGLDYELIFVNDGSVDDSPRLLNEFAFADSHVRIVHLTRNFGHQSAVTAGLSVARGDVVVIMDCDLQDPPEVLPQFLDKWQEGFQVIFAIRRQRKEWFGKRVAYWAFYRLLAAISELDIPLDSGDFCVLDRSAVNLLNSLPEQQRFVRGLRTWIGLKQTGVEYERSARQAGKPAYTFTALVKLAMDGLVSFSSVPLRFVTRLGLLSALGAVGIGIWVVASWLSGQPIPRGWASLACLVLLLSSAQLLSLGVIGEYLSRIFLEVKRRPNFLIGEIVEKAAPAQAKPPADGKPVSKVSTTPLSRTSP